jgi:hypothetical protein
MLGSDVHSHKAVSEVEDALGFVRPGESSCVGGLISAESWLPGAGIDA